VAFPTVASRSAGATSAVNTTSHAITMPSGITAGDLLVVIFSTDGNPTCTASAGWNKLGQASNTTAVTGAVFWKHATGGDTCTITTSATEQSSHVVLRITSGGIPVGTSANASSTNSNPPSYTDGYSTDYLWVATRSGDSTVVATAAPSGYSQLQTQAAAGSGGASTNTAERTNAAATEDPGTFTSATAPWVAWTLSIPTAVTLPGRTVLDDFGNGTVDVPPWENWGAPQTSESGGTMRVTSTTAAGYYGVDWDAAAIDVNEAYVGATLVAAGNQALVSHEAYPVLAIVDSSNSWYWRVAGNVVYATTTIAGVAANRTSFAYDAALHLRYVVGEAGGNIVWVWSVDGTVWRTAASLANPFGTTSVRPELLQGTYAAEASTTVVQWDDFAFYGATSATATPPAAAATSAVPAPSVSTSSAVAASPVAAPAAVPAAAVRTGSTSSPASVAAAAAVPAPTVSVATSATVTPGAVAASVAVPAPAPRTGSTSSPAPIAATSVLPAPVVSGSALALLVPVAAAAAIPAAAPRTGSTATPGDVAATAAVPVPLVGSVATATPATVGASSAVPAPGKSAGSTLAPAVVAATAAVPSASVSTGADTGVAAPVIQATTTVPQPALTTSSQIAPAPVTASASVPAVTASAGSTVGPVSVTGVVAISSPAVSGGATAGPPAVAALASVPAPVVFGRVTVAPAALAAVTAVLAPALSSASQVPPQTVALTVAFPQVRVRRTTGGTFATTTESGQFVSSTSAGRFT